MNLYQFKPELEWEALIAACDEMIRLLLIDAAVEFTMSACLVIWMIDE